MPKVTEITVSAGRVIPHPFVQYANLRPMITIKAELDEGEDFKAVAKDLQATAEGMIEDHSRYMVRSLEELENLTRKQARVASLEASIRRAQSDLDELRKDMPALQAIAGDRPASDGDDDEDDNDPFDDRRDSDPFRERDYP
jgi:hypothetical protein